MRNVAMFVSHVSMGQHIEQARFKLMNEVASALLDKHNDLTPLDSDDTASMSPSSSPASSPGGGRGGGSSRCRNRSVRSGRSQ